MDQRSMNPECMNQRNKNAENMNQTMAEPRKRKPAGKFGWFYLWLFIVGMVLCVVSFDIISFTGLFKVRETGFLLFGLLDILFLLIFVTGRLYWLEGISMEKSAAADLKERRRYAGSRLLVFIMGTIVYYLYCRDLFWNTIPGTTDDALAIAGLFCVTFVVSDQVYKLKES